MARAERTLHFDLVLLGFPNLSADQAVAALARAFAISPDRSREYIYQAPVTVVTDATEDLLKSYVRALHSLGADLQVTCTETQELWLLRSKDKQVRPARRETPVTLALINDELEDLDEDFEGELPEIVCPHCGKPQFSGRICQNCGRAIGLPTEGVSGSLPRHTGEAAAVPEDVALRPKIEQKPELEAKTIDPSDLGIRTYSLPDFTGDQRAVVSNKATGEFFVAGRKGRPFLKTGEFGPDGKKKKKKKRTVKFDRHGRVIEQRRQVERARDETDTTRRERIAWIAIVVCLLAVVVYSLTQVIDLPRRLTHYANGRELSVSLPGGYDAVESRDGVLNTQLGRVPYTIHQSRKRDDPVGALAFTSLVLPEDSFERYSERRLLGDALELVVEEHQGTLGRTRTVEVGDYSGLDAAYTATRFNRTYEGFVRILNADGAVVVLLCEGIGAACQTHEHSRDFFESFEVEDE